MIPKYIRIAGITKENRHDTIDYIVNSINSCSGWVLNHTMFSNSAICINFQIEAKGVHMLLKLLNGININFTKESVELWDSFPESIDEKYKDIEILGSINITFVHNEPDLKITTPNVPG